MKQLTCEMCGSTDLMKQDGVFVCQSCGCKYSVEEAKKLMVEGTVDVTGSTVKVDTSDELANLYQIARRAKDDNNAENAAKYYDMILIKDPTSWEAVFYSTYYKSMNCRVGEIQQAAIILTKSLDSVVELVNENIADTEEKIQIIDEICAHCIQITRLFIQAETNHWKKMSSDMLLQYTSKMANICFSCACIMYHLGDCIHTEFSNTAELYEYAISAWEAGKIFHSPTMNYSNDANQEKTIYEKYGKKVEILKDKIVEIKKEQINLYWSEHQEEKEKLEAEKNSLNIQISEYESEIVQIPGAVEVKNISDRIDQLSSEKSALGLFKMKEKKAIQEKIDAQNIELKKVEDRMNADRAEIQRKIAPLQSRINQINDELTKER